MVLPSLILCQDDASRLIQKASEALVRFQNAITRGPQLTALPAYLKPQIRANTVEFTYEYGGGGAIGRFDGKVLAFEKFNYSVPAIPDLSEPLNVSQAEVIARDAVKLTGIPYRLQILQTQPDGPFLYLWFNLYDGEYRLADGTADVRVNVARGEVENFAISGLEDRGVFPRRPAEIRFAATRDVARATVAATAFAESKGAVTALDSTQEPEPALWLAARAAPGGSEGAERAPGPTDENLAAAARGEGTPVWIVNLKGDARIDRGETVSFPLVKAYVDALTGRLLWFQYFDGNGLGGAMPLAKPRPAPALSGPAALTVAGKLRNVRLAPVAATRPFALSGRAVLGIDKRMLDAEYDAKAGLVRYKGKLARTVLTVP